jgi:lipooligosaccharide transport system permease protein
MSTPPTVRALRYWLVAYKRTWKATITTSFLNPLLFLAAMGLGLGTYVDKSASAVSALGGVDYVAFLAPGLLAATAMQSAAVEGMWPVMASIKWTRQYHAQLATPLRVVDIALGHFAFIALRLLTAAAIFLCVAALFGALESWTAVLAVPAAVLTGLAFATPIAAFSSTRSKEGGAFAALNRFVLIPMFLFSGAFFPVTQLPVGLRVVAYLTPLWHGVDLCRHLALGTGTPLGDLGHVAYLALFAVGGALVAIVSYRRRLEF